MGVAVLSCSDNTEECSVEITAEIDWDQAKSMLEECFSQLAEREGLEGDSSIETLKSRLGRVRFERDVARWIAARAMPNVVKSTERRIVLEPELVSVDAFRSGKPLRFSVVLYCLPEAKIEDLDALCAGLYKKAPQPAEPDVEEGVRALIERSASLREVAECHCARIGDIVSISLEVRAHGIPITPLVKSPTYARLSYSSLPVGLVDGLINMAVGETREFDIEVPERGAESDEDLELLQVRATLHGIFEKNYPETDDAWARRWAPNIANMDDLKHRVAWAMRKQNGLLAEQEFEDVIDRELAAALEVEIPGSMLAQSARQESRRLRAKLNEWGLTRRQYARMQGISESELDDSLKERGEQGLRQIIALETLFVEKAMELEEGDIDAALSLVAGGQEAALKRSAALDGSIAYVEDAARRYKAHRWLVSRVGAGGMN